LLIFGSTAVQRWTKNSAKVTEYCCWFWDAIAFGHAHMHYFGE
jgi:hypothetical protein